MMSETERNEFRLYLQACTLNQVHGVYDKEFKANRMQEAGLALEELIYRGEIGDDPNQ